MNLRASGPATRVASRGDVLASAGAAGVRVFSRGPGGGRWRADAEYAWARSVSGVPLPRHGSPTALALGSAGRVYLGFNGAVECLEWRRGGVSDGCTFSAPGRGGVSSRLGREAPEPARRGSGPGGSLSREWVVAVPSLVCDVTEAGPNVLALGLSGDLFVISEEVAEGRRGAVRVPLGVSGIFFSGALASQPGGGTLVCLGGAGSRAELLVLGEGYAPVCGEAVRVDAFPVFSVSFCQSAPGKVDLLLACGKRAYVCTVEVGSGAADHRGLCGGAPGASPRAPAGNARGCSAGSDAGSGLDAGPAPLLSVTPPAEVLAAGCRLFSGALTRDCVFLGSEHGEIHSIPRPADARSCGVGVGPAAPTVVALEHAQVWAIAPCGQGQVAAVTESGACIVIAAPLRAGDLPAAEAVRLDTRALRIQPRRDYCAFPGGSLLIMHGQGSFHGPRGEPLFSFFFPGNPYCVSHAGSGSRRAASGARPSLLHLFGLEGGRVGLAWHPVSSLEGFSMVPASEASEAPEPLEAREGGVELSVQLGGEYSFATIPLLCGGKRAITTVLLLAASLPEESGGHARCSRANALSLTLLVPEPQATLVRLTLFPSPSVDPCSHTGRIMQYSAVIDETPILPLDLTEGGLARVSTHFFSSTAAGEAAEGRISVSQLSPVVGTVVGAVEDAVAVVVTRGAIVRVFSGLSTGRPRGAFVHACPGHQKLATRVFAAFHQGVLGILVVFRDALSVSRYDVGRGLLVYQAVVSRKTPSDAAVADSGFGFWLVHQAAEDAAVLVLEQFDWSGTSLKAIRVPFSRDFFPSPGSSARGSEGGPAGLEAEGMSLAVWQAVGRGESFPPSENLKLRDVEGSLPLWLPPPHSPLTQGAATEALELRIVALASLTRAERGRPRKEWERELVAKAFRLPLELDRLQPQGPDGSEINAMCHVQVPSVSEGSTDLTGASGYIVAGHESGVLELLGPGGSRGFLWRARASVKSLAFCGGVLFVGASNGILLALLLQPAGPAGLRVASSSSIDLPLPCGLSARYTAITAVPAGEGILVIAGDGAGGLTAFSVVSSPLGGGVSDGEGAREIPARVAVVDSATRLEISSVPLGLTVLSREASGRSVKVRLFISGTLCVHVVDVRLGLGEPSAAAAAPADRRAGGSPGFWRERRRTGGVVYTHRGRVSLALRAELRSAHGAVFGALAAPTNPAGAVAVTDGGHLVEYGIEMGGASDPRGAGASISLLRERWVSHCGLVAIAPASWSGGAVSAVATLGWDRTVRVISLDSLAEVEGFLVPVFNPHSLCVVRGGWTAGEGAVCGLSAEAGEAREVGPLPLRLLAAGSGIAAAELRQG